MEMVSRLDTMLPGWDVCLCKCALLLDQSMRPNVHFDPGTGSASCRMVHRINVREHIRRNRFEGSRAHSRMDSLGIPWYRHDPVSVDSHMCEHSTRCSTCWVLRFCHSKLHRLLDAGKCNVLNYFRWIKRNNRKMDAPALAAVMANSHTIVNWSHTVAMIISHHRMIWWARDSSIYVPKQCLLGSKIRNQKWFSFVGVYIWNANKGISCLQCANWNTKWPWTQSISPFKHSRGTEEIDVSNTLENRPPHIMFVQQFGN